jgi:hypothetical protein
MMHIAIYLIACGVVGVLGRRHRWLGFWGIFACSLLLTPLVGLLVVGLSRGGYEPARRPTDDVA